MTRLQTALIRALPTLITLPLCAALAVAGVLPWGVLFAVPVALALLALTRAKGKRVGMGAGIRDAQAGWACPTAPVCSPHQTRPGATLVHGAPDPR